MRVLTGCLFALVLTGLGTSMILAPLRAAEEAYSAGGDPGTSKGWPELLGVLKSREIVIDSPRLTINLPEKGGVAKVTISSGPSLTPLITMIEKLAFKTVHLKNGTFVFRTPSGFTQTIYGVNATISGDRNSAITTAKGRFKFRGEELSFDISSVNKTAGANKGSVPVSIILKGAKINAQLAGSFGLGEGFELEGKLQLSLPDLKFVSAGPDEIVIDSPRLTINLPEKGGVAKVTISSGPSLTPLITMIEKLAFKTVHLKNGTFVFRTPSGFTQTIYGVNATISGDRNSAITTAKGRFKFRGEELSFDISSVNKTAGANKGSVPVSIILKGAKINAQLAGSFGLGEGFELEGKLQLSLPDLKFVSAWLGYPMTKAVKFGELRANGAFSWKGSLLSFADATFSSGGNQAMGTFSVDLAGARPRVDGTLALENIDIDEQIFGPIFASLAGPQAYSLSADPSEGFTSSVVENYLQNTSLDLNYLNDFDAYIRLSADKVNLGSLIAEDCAFTLTLKSGDLFFGLVESKLAGGLAHGEIDLKTIKGVRRSNLRVNLENVEIGGIIGAFNWKSPFKGVGHLKVDLAGRGEDLKAHIKTLSGEVSLKTLDGVYFAIDMKNFIREKSEEEKLTWWTELLTSSRFKEFKADFIFKDGLAISRSMLINGGDFGVTASGSINIPARRFYFSFQRVAGSEQGTKDEGEFNDSSVNAIVVHGPWKALKIAVGGSIGAKDSSSGDGAASDQISKDGELPLENYPDPGRG